MNCQRITLASERPMRVSCLQAIQFTAPPNVNGADEEVPTCVSM